MLAEQSQRLQAFKTSNVGELPEQQQSNLAALTDVRDRIGNVAASLLQAQQQNASLVIVAHGSPRSALQSQRTELLKRFHKYFAAPIGSLWERPRNPQEYRP